MLIPTGFQKLPSKEGCFNNQILFGGTTSQMSGAAAQLSNCKFLGQAHYHVGQTILPAIGGMISFATGTSGTTKTNRTYNFLYQSTSLSSHIALLIQYRASNFEIIPVSIEAKLRATGSNSYTSTILDHGIKFEEALDLESDRDEISQCFTGSELISAPSNTLPDPVRPLYVPSSNRGELLNVVIETTQVLPISVHIYDLLIPSVTP
tara:strand:+ start:37 stop:657 length:621 start_codon:yes stop_codon:yes gene_type:complete